jgi:hypothetical protein
VTSGGFFLIYLYSNEDDALETSVDDYGRAREHKSWWRRECRRKRIAGKWVGKRWNYGERGKPS